MSDIPREIVDLIQSPTRLSGSDSDIEAAFWTAYPRFRFFKALPWGARLLDIGAGSGGLALWREWQAPIRSDIRMFGVDQRRGEHAQLYEGWQVVDLDEGLPRFRETLFEGFLASHVIEHLADPARLFRDIAAAAAPKACIYLEWPSPATARLPSATRLQSEHGFLIQTFNFHDDHTHRRSPERQDVERMLLGTGFRTIESAETRLGLLAEEMIARGRMRDDLTFRQMGLWSAVGWSNVVIAQLE